jgi:hypothetical protein
MHSLGKPGLYPSVYVYSLCILYTRIVHLQQRNANTLLLTVHYTLYTMAPSSYTAPLSLPMHIVQPSAFLFSISCVLFDQGTGISHVDPVVWSRCLEHAVHVVHGEWC